MKLFLHVIFLFEFLVNLATSLISVYDHEFCFLIVQSQFVADIQVETFIKSVLRFSNITLVSLLDVAI